MESDLQVKLQDHRYVKDRGTSHGAEFQAQLIIFSLKKYHFLSLMRQLAGNEYREGRREEETQYSGSSKSCWCSFCNFCG